MEASNPIPRGGARVVRAFWAMVVAAALAAALAGVASSAQPLTGIDVSNWQHEIDWLSLAGSGHTFVFAKATESTTFADVTYPLNRTGARGIGLRFGAYHFAQPSGASDAAAVASATAQADYFLSVAQPAPGDLLPVLDLERNGGLSVARLTLWTQTWVDEVEARTGLDPIIYVSPSFWKERLGDTPTFATNGNRLWIAHWTKETLPILPGGSWGALGWTFWQWTSCARIAGIGGCVDGDRFNGTTLSTALISSYPQGTPVSLGRPVVAGTPQVGALLAVRPVKWSGSKPLTLSYQWQRCDTAATACAPIPGATTASYKSVSADVGRVLAVAVSAQTGSGGSATSVSLPTLAVAASGAPAAGAPVARVLPAVQGLSTVGQTLLGSAGAWTGSPTAFGYQWRRCQSGGTCEAIAGAGSTTYALTPGDIGSSIQFVVTATGRGGTRSATSVATAVVAPAPVPQAVVGSLVAQAGQAGAVTTPLGTAIASWQPGAVPAARAIALADSVSRLALQGTAVSLTTGPDALPWPIDVQYAPRADEVVAGFLPVAGTWRPLAELSSATLPVDQSTGVYRDPAGGLHVLTRVAGRVALFSAGKWGDPRFVASTRPRLTLLSSIVASRRPDRHVLLLGRFAIDTQAHLYASVVAPGGARIAISPTGSRLGWWLKGVQPTKTVQALQLRPGALPIRLRVSERALRGPGPYTVKIVAIDPYGRRSSLVARFGAPSGSGAAAR